MIKWQIINDVGMTIDLIEAATPKFAVKKARGKRNQLNPYYDIYWQIEKTDGNKINLKH